MSAYLIFEKKIVFQWAHRRAREVNSSDNNIGFERTFIASAASIEIKNKILRRARDSLAKNRDIGEILCSIPFAGD